MKKLFKHHGGKLSLLAVAILFAGSIIYSQQAASANDAGVVIHEHVKGNPDASVVLTKYGDFECPFCAAAAPVVDQLLEEFGEDIRFEYKHLPLTQIHRFAESAAVAAEAAGQQGEFFAYHDLLYQQQNRWARSGNPPFVFTQFAEELGLDMDLFRQHQGSSKLRTKVRTETREAMLAGYNSTPTFTLNGERIQYTGYEGLRDLISTAIASSSIGSEVDDIKFSI